MELLHEPLFYMEKRRRKVSMNNYQKVNTEEIYHGLGAITYDFYEKGVKDDIDFYLSYFKNYKGKILEIGAGTGRITIPLLKAYLDITALDISSDMLIILKEKAQKENITPKIVVADMRNLSKVEKFDTIFISYRTFQHLYTVNDQLYTLREIKKHLKKDGVLIFDVYYPIFKYIALGNWKWQVEQKIDVENIGKVKIDYRNKYDMASQIMYQEDRYKLSSGKVEVIPYKMRFFFRFEIEHLLSLAGFEIINLYGDFKKNKFKNGSSEMIWEVKHISTP